jgi:5-methyltetrahydrofolate--homocysteine methyltransferase
MAEYDALTEALVQCDSEKVNQLVKTMLDEGKSAGSILNQGLVAAMDIIGDKMESGDMFIPEVLMAAQIMNGAVETLKPLLAEGDIGVKGKVVIGTVKGDLHDIGKNLVAMMLASSGLEVVNLGVDIPPEQFVSETKAQQAQIVCLSALLTTTMPMMKATIDALADSGLRSQVKVMVGGAPVTQGFADEIGADGFAPDAGSAAKMAKALID